MLDTVILPEDFGDLGTFEKTGRIGRDGAGTKAQAAVSGIGSAVAMVGVAEKMRMAVARTWRGVSAW